VKKKTGHGVIFAMTASTNEARPKIPTIRFDSDSVDLLVDTGCSRTISNHAADFTTLHKVPDGTTIIQGVDGHLISPAGIGVVQFAILDDLGQRRYLTIDEALLVPTAPIRLLSPQQWAQQRLCKYGDTSAQCIATAQTVQLQWDEGDTRATCTIPLNSKNVGMLTTAPGFDNFLAATATAQWPPSVDFSPSEGVSNDLPPSPDEKSFLSLHQRLGHMSWDQMRGLARAGLLPSRFQHLRNIKCAGCLYGKAHRTPWRTRAESRPIQKATLPGAFVSTDQLESRTPGLIPQAKGALTTRRYQCATVFVDHMSDYTYIALMEDLTLSSTLNAKHEFEAHAAAHGVKIQAYHADNGRFADAQFLADAATQGQQVTFCGVGAHHQNGVAERRIRDIVESGRSMLLHAVHRWPKAVTPNLWPQALKYACFLRNSLPRHGNP
jgi:hypothetical protein